MNRNLSLLTALSTSLALAPFAAAQAAAAPATAPAAAPVAVAPQAVSAKVALVNFQDVVIASNEGQVATLSTQKKFEPKKNEIDRLNADVDAKNKSLQAAPATLPDDERAKRLREIDTLQKQLNRDAEDASTAYQTDLQEALTAVAQKIAPLMKKYVADNGYTILLDVSSQQSNVLWALPSTDISQAVVDIYNKQSGIAAPPPQSPRAGGARPAGTTPRPAGTTTRPATAKPPTP